MAKRIEVKANKVENFEENRDKARDENCTFYKVINVINAYGFANREFGRAEMNLRS